MNSLEIIKLQEEYAVKRDEREFSLGDMLDVKTSIILAVIVFLAAQSDSFFSSKVSGWSLYLQYVSIVALVLAGVFAVLELWPRNYQQEDSPIRYDEWIEKLKIHYAETAGGEQDALGQAISGRAQRARERAELNIQVNEKKSNLLQLAFYFTVASLASNLATLAMRLF